MALALAPAPNFFLYGEPPQAAAESFLHLEPLDTRSRPSRWNIAAHRHADLNHLFLLTHGGGVMQLEEGAQAFAAPCLLAIPAGAVHGFAYRADSMGQVLTLASSLLTQKAARSDMALDGLFESPRSIACGEELAQLQEVFARLARELAWRAPGHVAAVEACVLQLLVTALRLSEAEQVCTGGAAAADSRLVARMRERVEQRFRDHEPLQAYAQALGVSLSRLRQACRRSAGCAPSALIQQRRLVEAKRALLYSDTRIADVALGLGFEDVAYFSRFFGKHTQISPRQFRGRR
jgi:AraC family transcriptional activator of pobA